MCLGDDEVIVLSICFLFLYQTWEGWGRLERPGGG